MKRAIHFQLLKNIAIGFCLMLMLSISVRAESQETNSNSKRKIVFLDSFEPPGDDKPKDTGAGGSRDGSRCNSEEQPIRALMPQGNFGLTFNAQPNIYLHLPQTSAKQVVLAMQDEAGTEYARAFLPIETNNNVASFALPEDEMFLEAGKNYQWKISVVCGEYLKPGDPTFTGWVQRVELHDIQKQLGFNPSKEQIRALAQQGYWYDLLDAISVQQRSAIAPDNSLDSWQQIVDLGFDYKN